MGIRTKEGAWRCGLAAKIIDSNSTPHPQDMRLQGVLSLTAFKWSSCLYGKHFAKWAQFFIYFVFWNCFIPQTGFKSFSVDKS